MKYLCLIENVSDVSVSHASGYGKKKIFKMEHLQHPFLLSDDTPSSLLDI